MNIILLGPPGTGKGTQAERLSAVLKVPHISTGEELRNIAKQKTALGKKVKSLLSTGNLLPDDIVVDVVKERLKSKDCKNGFTLDGFPRNLNQAKALAKFAHIDLAICIDSSDKIIIKRLSARRQCEKCGKIYGLDIKPKKEGICDVCGGRLYQRKDDQPEIIRKRLKVYSRETAPLIDYYKSKGILRKVNGEQKIEKILDDILRIIKLAKHEKKA